MEVVEDLEAVRPADVRAVGHRVVHGGRHLVEPTVIDDAARASIEELAQVAPLHNAAALSLQSTQHGSMLPRHASRRRVRHGFPRHHAGRGCDLRAPTNLARGLGDPPVRLPRTLRAVVYRARGRAPRTTQATPSAWSFATSAVAARSRQSVTGIRSDTTMGFTPLEGVPMATRSGSVDPGVLLYLQRVHGLSARRPRSSAQHRVGDRGTFGRPRRARARGRCVGRRERPACVEVFTYRVAAAVAAMGAALGGIDAIAFTAGVGEHSPAVRSAVCARLGFLGVSLDPELNSRSTPDSDISNPESEVRVLVIAAREELVAARAVRSLLEARTER